MLRRFVTLAVSCCFVLSMAVVPVELLLAQDAKQAVPPPTKAQAVTKETPTPAQTKPGDQAKTAEPTKDDSAKKDAGKTEPAKPAEPPLKPIPPEVQAKIDAARKAVAEAIVAAQDAGLIETSIDPPPILDLLIDGRVTDARTLKAPKQAGLAYGVSPEVFGAWFTGYGKMEGIDYEHDVRIVPPSGGTDPSKGLKQWYDQRARHPRAIYRRDPQDPSGTGQKGRDEARTGQSGRAGQTGCCHPGCCHPGCCHPGCCHPGCCHPECRRSETGRTHQEAVIGISRASARNEPSWRGRGRRRRPGLVAERTNGSIRCARQPSAAQTKFSRGLLRRDRA